MRASRDRPSTSARVASTEAHEEADRPCWKIGQGVRVIQRDGREGRQHLLPERTRQERSIRLRQRLENYRAELEGGGADAPLLQTASLHAFWHEHDPCQAA